MRKLSSMAAAVSTLMLLGMDTAAADGINWCRFFPWLPWCQAPGGGGTVSVSEPTMLALFGIGLVLVLAFTFYRRRRVKRTRI